MVYIDEKQIGFEHFSAKENVTVVGLNGMFEVHFTCKSN